MKKERKQRAFQEKRKWNKCKVEYRINIK